MSYWNAKYPNDHGEYEITFGSKARETTKAVEKVCTAVMDGLVKSPEDVKIVVHAHWIDTGDSFEDEHCRYNYWECSACGNRIAGRYGLHDYCPNCGAHMDEEVAR